MSETINVLKPTDEQEGSDFAEWLRTLDSKEVFLQALWNLDAEALEFFWGGVADIMVWQQMMDVPGTPPSVDADEEKAKFNATVPIFLERLFEFIVCFMDEGKRIEFGLEVFGVNGKEVYHTFCRKLPHRAWGILRVNDRGKHSYKFVSLVRFVEKLQEDRRHMESAVVEINELLPRL